MNLSVSGAHTPQFFQECIDDLDSARKQLTETEWRYARNTVLAIRLLFEKRKEISAIADEDERNERITHSTKLYAEPGLIPGKTPEEIEQSILTRVDLLKRAFFFDRAKNQTLLLYKEGFIGPPCFNGRVITLQHYVFHRQGFKSELFYEYSTPLDHLAAKLEEVMYACAEHYEMEDGAIPTLAQIQEFAAANPELFQKYELETHSKDFAAIYRRSCQFYVE